MWLLDANLDIHLLELLQRFQIDCDTAAAKAGFRALLTRGDRLFAESAARGWRALPDLSLVIVNLPQLPSARYLEAFRTAWAASPIRPQPGRTITWP